MIDLITAPENCFAAHADAYSTGQYVRVTSDNLDEVISSMAALDQAEELAPGCITWAIFYDPGDQRGQMTVWPNGRGAMACGGDSVWGDWDEDSQTLQIDDGGGTYDCDGEIIPTHERHNCEDCR